MNTRVWQNKNACLCIFPDYIHNKLLQVRKLAKHKYLLTTEGTARNRTTDLAIYSQNHRCRPLVGQCAVLRMLSGSCAQYMYLLSAGCTRGVQVKL